jgi:hypothetical protein
MCAAGVEKVRTFAPQYACCRNITTARKRKDSRMKQLYAPLIALGAFLLSVAAATAGPLPPWDNQINNPSRFKVLNEFGGAAVLDKETGLVWEQAPSTAEFSWFDAHVHCNRLIAGDRLGWRLPTLQELASLLDPSVPVPGPALPPGHPFSNVQSDGPQTHYWAATTDALNPSFAWVISFRSASGVTNGIPKTASILFAWCVRAGQGVEAQ